MGRKICRLKDLAASGRSVISGPFGSNIGKRFFQETGVPVIRGNNLSTDHKKFSEKGFVYITEEKARELDSYAIRNDILFTAAGTIGQVGIVPRNSNFEKYVISNKQLRVRIDPVKADPDFVFYWLASPWIFKAIQDRNTGSTVPLINLGTIKGLPVELPGDVSAQRLISGCLGAFDAKIELNNRINEELEGLAKLLYDYWFVQFDFPISAARASAMGDPALEGKPYRQSGGKMVYNQTLKREIPEGWDVDALENCVSKILDHRGKTPKKLGGDWSTDDDAIIALSAKIVKGGKLVGLERANKVDKELFDKWMPSKLIDGDILMTSEAPAGEFYFIHGKTDYCLSQRLFGIRANPEVVTPAYLYHELSIGNAYHQILGSLSGSTVFGIRQDVLRTIKVVIPETTTLQGFEKIALPIMKQIKVIERQNQHLTELRDWLLPMLMNGQVTVGDPQADSPPTQQG